MGGRRPSGSPPAPAPARPPAALGVSLARLDVTLPRVLRNVWLVSLSPVSPSPAPPGPWRGLPRVTALGSRNAGEDVGGGQSPQLWPKRGDTSSQRTAASPLLPQRWPPAAAAPHTPTGAQARAGGLAAAGLLPLTPSSPVGPRVGAQPAGAVVTSYSRGGMPISDRGRAPEGRPGAAAEPGLSAPAALGPRPPT